MPQIGQMRARATRWRRVTVANIGAAQRSRRYVRGLPVPVPGPSRKPVHGDLRAYFDAHEHGPGLWKWLHYFEIYERHLARFRGQEVHIVEVGIFSGGSIDMWLSYFGDRCRFYGLDVEAACKNYERPRVEVFIGDQADLEFWARFRAEVPRVDILIDDGGHLPEQQMATLEAMLPHIVPGGVYLCEDIQGAENAFHTYLDVLSRSLSSFVGMGPIPPSPVHQHVASVHRYPQATVIEKPRLPIEPFDAPRRGTEWQPGFSDEMLRHDYPS
jgi:hypothetical protein